MFDLKELDSLYIYDWENIFENLEREWVQLLTLFYTKNFGKDASIFSTAPLN